MSSGKEQFGEADQPASPHLPLALGFRVLSEETTSPRLRRIFAEMSDRLEAGADPADVLSRYADRLPADFAALVTAADRLGSPASVLQHYLDYVSADRDIRRSLRMALVYPVLLLAAAAALMIFLLVFVVAEYRPIFEDFGVEVPGVTAWFLQMADFLTRYGTQALAAISVAAAGMWLLRALPGPRLVLGRIARASPLWGSVWECSAIARLSHLLALFLRERVPLPEALRLTGRAMGSPSLNRGCQDLADEIERGTPPVQAVRKTLDLPVDLEHVFQWSDRGEAFADLLESSGHLYRLRAQLYARTAALVVEPLVIAGVAILVALMLIAMFLPLMKMLNALS
ncbi:MAG: hypothetical protein GXP27_07805 [Planctomycetes bacterium]|nr:hypothetical protein [Planctomycetota bacterium]